MENFLNKITKGDCMELLKSIPDNSIDLIFADPPYNMQLQGDLTRPNDTIVDGVDDDWDKFDSFFDYDNFCKSWLSECRRILKPTGSIRVIGSYHNIFRVGKIMQDLGFWILNDIIRVKNNPMPNFKGTRFNNAHETLIRASKTQGSKYTFHYKGMKAFNDDKQMRSDWHISICLGNERLKDDKGIKIHSTQKPEELLYRVILSSSNVGDIVLDPFMGSGTTGAVAKLLKRNFIGFEKEEKYIKAAEKRIEKVSPIDEDIGVYKIETPRPKVAFGNLVSAGLITPGDYLYNKSGNIKAVILADGTLEYNGEIGSIHKISAHILGKSTNNGRDFWYKKDGNDFILIDKLRDYYITEK